MPEVVDPSPVINERLAVLASEHEPGIENLKNAIDAASPDEAKALRKELRQANRAYASARREIEKLRGPGAAW